MEAYISKLRRAASIKKAARDTEGKKNCYGTEEVEESRRGTDEGKS